MSLRISSDMISIYAERTIRQYSEADFDSLLGSGMDAEDYFECQVDWENEEYEDFEYHIEVSGVVSQTEVNTVRTQLQERIQKLEKQIEALLKKELDLDGALDKAKKEEEE